MKDDIGLSQMMLFCYKLTENVYAKNKSVITGTELQK